MDKSAMDSSEASAHIDRLVNLNLTSPESIAIIRKVLPHCQQLEDHVLQVFIDVLDKAIPVIRSDSNLYQKCLRALRKICGTSGLLPSNYLLSEGLVRKEDWPAAYGGFADVWEGTYRNQRVAIKSMRVYININATELRKAFYKEVVIWKHLSHSNVVPFLGVSDLYSPMSIISEWMPHGNINEYLRARPEANRMRLLVSVCKGLQYLHQSNIVHCDLKGANILINSSEDACLSDFGLTSLVSGLNTVNASTFDGGHRGTCRWMAPELLNPDVVHSINIGHSTATDIYALSMVTVEIFSARLPFPDLSSDASVILKVMQGVRPRLSDEMLQLGLSGDIWKLVNMCWENDQTKRPEISYILNRMRAATPGISVLEGLENFDPSSEASIDILRATLESSLDKTLGEDLTKEDYVAYIDILDRALESPHVDTELRKRCVNALATVYERTTLLPLSYILPDTLTKKYEKPSHLGTYADVWEGIYNDCTVAIKVLRTSRLDRDEMVRKRVFEEAVILKGLSHPNIAPFLGISDASFPCIVLEWMAHGNLMEYVRSSPEENKLQLLIDIGLGLEYLHARDIVHGDLKAAHILVNAAKHACITGFRININNFTFTNHTGYVSSETRLVPEASYRWAAPECLDPDSAGLSTNAFSAASDIYAFAMVSIEIFTGRVPFSHIDNESAIILRIARGLRPERPKEASGLGLTDDTWELIQMCWQGNPEKRPEISSVLQYLRRPAPGLSRPERLGLTDFDPSSSHCMDTLRSVLNSTDVEIILGCDDLDALMFIDMLGRAIFSTLSDSTLDRIALSVVSRLWDRTHMLPSSYQLPEGVEVLNEPLYSASPHATVRKALYKTRFVAVKTYHNTRLAQKMFINDVFIWKQLSHPNIIPFLGVSSVFGLISPWSKTNLRHYLNTSPEANRLSLILDIAHGLQYLHSLNIVHGLLNRTTVLVNEDDRACLTNFSLSVIRDPTAEVVDFSDTINDGIVLHMAPELLLPRLCSSDTRARSMRSDIYAFGHLQAKVFLGGTVFDHLPHEQIIIRVSNGERPKKPSNAADLGLPDDLWELIEACWHQDQYKRPNISTALKRLQTIYHRPPASFVESSSESMGADSITPTIVVDDLDGSSSISMKKGSKIFPSFSTSEESSSSMKPSKKSRSIFASFRRQ